MQIIDRVQLTKHQGVLICVNIQVGGDVRAEKKNRSLRLPSQKLRIVAQLTKTNFFFIEMRISGPYQDFYGFWPFFHQISMIRDFWTFLSFY